LNTNIYSYFETSGGQSSNLYLNVVHFSTPMLMRHLWQLKTVVFLRWCLIRNVLLAFQKCFKNKELKNLKICINAKFCFLFKKWKICSLLSNQTLRTHHNLGDYTTIPITSTLTRREQILAHSSDIQWVNASLCNTKMSS
jgi:hypothetical protein